MKASLILCIIFVIVQVLDVSIDGVSAEAQKNAKPVKAPAKKTQPRPKPEPEPEKQKSADDEEEVVDEESAGGEAEEQSSLMGSVVKEATKTGSHLLNSGTDVVKKTGRGTRRISQAGLKNGNKVADEGVLAVVGFINGLGNIFSDIFKNGRKIAGAKTKVLRNTGNNLTNLGVSSTNLFGQAINTPIKMLGDTADVASVGLTIPANASNFAKGKATGVLKALGATVPGSSEKEESVKEEEEEEEEEVTDEEDSDVEEPEPLVSQKPVSPKPTRVQKPTQPAVKTPSKVTAARSHIRRS